MICTWVFVSLVVTTAFAAHDTCNDPLEISSNNFMFSGNTELQSESTFSEKKGFAVQQKGFYFKYTGTNSTMIATTCDTRTLLPTKLILFDSCSEDGTASNPIIINSQFCGNQSSFEFFGEQDHTYFIFVTGSKNLVGSFFFSLTEKATAPTTCSDAPFFQPDNLPVSYHGQGSGWYHLLPDKKGKTILAHTCNGLTTTDTVIEVYKNCERKKEEIVAYNDDGCGYQSRALFNTEESQDYWIYVYSIGAEGQYMLTVSHFEVPTREVPLFTPALPTSHKFIIDPQDNQQNITCGDVTAPLYGIWLRLRGRGENMLIKTSAAGSIAVYNNYSNDECITKDFPEGRKKAKLTFFAELNTEYDIFVGSKNTGETISYHIEVTHQGGRQCDNGIILSIPDFIEGAIQQNESRWYRVVNIYEEAAPIILRLKEYRGFTDPFIEIYSDCAQEYIYKTPSKSVRVSFTAVARHEYFIRVGGNGSGTFDLELLRESESYTGRCTDPQMIKEVPLAQRFQTTGKESVFDGCSKKYSKGSFFAYTGTGDKVTFYTSNTATSFDTFIAVYDECSTTGNMPCLAYNDDFNEEPTASLSFVGEKDKNYLVYVGGTSGNEGVFSLGVISNGAIENDCNSATNVTDGGRWVGQTSGTKPTESVCDGGMRVGMWYTLSGPGDFRISTCSPHTEFEATITVYDGCGTDADTKCLAMETASCAQNGNTFFLHAENKTYHIFVSRIGQDGGLFELLVNRVTKEEEKQHPKTYFVLIVLLAVLGCVGIFVICFVIHRQLEKKRRKEDTTENGEEEAQAEEKWSINTDLEGKNTTSYGTIDQKESGAATL